MCHISRRVYWVSFRRSFKRWISYRYHVVMTMLFVWRIGQTQWVFVLTATCIFKRQEIERLVQDMLKEGTIWPSTNPFSSLVGLVKQNDGYWHFCVDYRALNRGTVAEKTQYQWLTSFLMSYTKLQFLLNSTLSRIIIKFEWKPRMSLKPLFRLTRVTASFLWCRSVSQTHRPPSSPVWMRYLDHSYRNLF